MHLQNPEDILDQEFIDNVDGERNAKAEQAIVDALRERQEALKNAALADESTPKPNLTDEDDASDADLDDASEVEADYDQNLFNDPKKLALGEKFYE
mmetsp:Transcript_6871/g.9478  ORF Transcript_6871/g.9478 Transcript_6871/m.9478 type:complete len:97 (-) Transcript_6871:1389-1679(-)